MGMMKEHVRGPIKCAETLAADVCLKSRALELAYHEDFKAIPLHTDIRGQEDDLGGNSTARVLGSQCIHTNPDVLRGMLRVILEVIAGTGEGDWYPEDYQHEDLLIQEFASARVSASTRFTVDWKSGNKKTSDYFLYYSMIKDENATPPFRKDKDEPEPPSMEELESMERPPPDYVQQHSDYYHHHYVGQVLTVIVNEC